MILQNGGTLHVFFDSSAIKICAAADGFVVAGGFVKDFTVTGEEIFGVEGLGFDAGDELFAKAGGVGRCACGVMSGNENAADGLFQFADVAGPCVSFVNATAERRFDVSDEFGGWFAEHARKRVLDELSKFSGVLLKALAQWRNFDHVRTKAIEEVLAK